MSVFIFLIEIDFYQKHLPHLFAWQKKKNWHQKSNIIHLLMRKYSHPRERITIIGNRFIIYSLWPSKWWIHIYTMRRHGMATAGKHKLDDNLCYSILKNHLRTASSHLPSIRMLQLFTTRSEFIPYATHTRTHIHMSWEMSTAKKNILYGCYASINTRYNCRFRLFTWFMLEILPPTYTVFFFHCTCHCRQNQTNIVLIMLSDENKYTQNHKI